MSLQTIKTFDYFIIILEDGKIKNCPLCIVIFLTLQFSSVTQSWPTLCDPMNHSTPGLPFHHQLLEFTKLMSIELVMPSNHLILCCPCLLPPSIFPRIRVFSDESVLRIRWPKYWSFSFNISPPNEYSGLISFRMDWLDLHYIILYKICNKVLLSHKKMKSCHLWCHG